MNRPLQHPRPSRSSRLTEVRKQHTPRDSRFSDSPICPDCGKGMSPYGANSYKCDNCQAETVIH
jgi:tRNA(Ile2) C34 agmatinyltransferase TiaS